MMLPYREIHGFEHLALSPEQVERIARLPNASDGEIAILFNLTIEQAREVRDAIDEPRRQAEADADQREQMRREQALRERERKEALDVLQHVRYAEEVKRCAVKRAIDDRNRLRRRRVKARKLREEARRTTNCRPLDMGGPRDVWLTFSPGPDPRLDFMEPVRAL